MDSRAEPGPAVQAGPAGPAEQELNGLPEAVQPVVDRPAFINYPSPLKGPDVPYNNDRKSNPGLRGWAIKPAAFVMEKSPVVSKKAWHNAGFGSLRDIRHEIEDYTSWLEPTVIPLPGAPASDKAPEASLPPPRHTEGRNPQAYPASKYYSVEDYHQLYLAGEITPTDVAKFLLPLIRREEEGTAALAGPHALAFFQSKADRVLAAAAASTRRYKEGQSLGPLDGVPTAVKDEYDIEGYQTCLGSVRDYTGKIKEDGCITSWCVRKLQEAGAVIIGKTSMHEFGLDTSGNNPVKGTPPNPFNKSYYTGGSSSGTGYAVSAGLIPIGLGSDGGGSIRIPASMCGVFGLKPTTSRLSFLPGQNHSLMRAVLGPLAGDVRSLLTVFETVAAPHPTSLFPPFRLTGSPRLRPRVLGIPEAWFKAATPAVQALCRDVINRLVAERGYEIINIDIPFLVHGQTAHALTVLAEAAGLLTDTRGLTPANRIMLALGRLTPVDDFLLAQKLRRALGHHLAWLWQQHPGMLIVTPTTSCEGWPVLGGEDELRHGVNDGDQTIKSMEYVWLASFLGLPSMSVPAGFVGPRDADKGRAGAPVEEQEVRDKVRAVPVGLMATAEWCAEEALLRWGLDCEEVAPDRRARPPVWVDVVEGAREKAREEAEGAELAAVADGLRSGPGHDDSV